MLTHSSAMSSLDTVGNSIDAGSLRGTEDWT
jgi:hypothetical protein